MQPARGATLETGHDPSPLGRIKRRAATQSVHHLPDHRGLKPTATSDSRSGGLAAAISALSDGLYFCRFSVIIALFFLICVLQLPWINQNQDVYSPQSRW